MEKLLSESDDTSSEDDEKTIKNNQYSKKAKGFFTKRQSSLTTTNKLLFISNLTNGLYPIPQPVPKIPAAHGSKMIDESIKWHRILGHIGVERLIKAANMLDGIPAINRSTLEKHQCIPCIESTTKRAPIKQPQPRITQPLELTHTDMSGKLGVPTLGKAHYFAVFLDDATAMSAIYLLQHKSEFINCFVNYKELVQNQLSRRMYAIRLDNAGEQSSKQLHQFIDKNGMVLEYSPPYASQSNGSSERLIQELWKVARTMLFDARLDMELWGEAISHANWLKNRLPAKRINLQIPYVKWFNRTPNMSALQQFGQPGYAFQYRPDTAKNKKFLPRTMFGYFVGMESNNTLYRIYLPTTKSVYICRRMTSQFFLTIHPYNPFQH
uniref:Integrase n=1 Tax=Digenea simplex TaxID=945030 RepID=A0A4D6I7U6_DIGSM|nr:integrase [Digenea simplex]